jgi:hypothetical protein
MSDDVERICRQCPAENRYERRVMLRQEAPDGTTWYLCIRCWVDWDRDERGSRTIGVFVPPDAAPPPVTTPLRGGDDATTTARKAKTKKPASAATKRSTSGT